MFLTILPIRINVLIVMILLVVDDAISGDVTRCPARGFQRGRMRREAADVRQRRPGIRDVSLSVIGDDVTWIDSVLHVSTDDTLQLVAHLQPPPGGDGAYYYRWQWGTAPGQAMVTRVNSTSVAFDYDGRYELSVSVGHRLDRTVAITSPPLPVRVLQKLLAPVLLHQPQRSVLRGRRATFTARYDRGSDLVFRWDFGDGTPVVVTSNTSVRHSYLRIGEYLLVVRVSNILSQQVTNATVFVLDQRCDTPEVVVVGTGQLQPTATFPRTRSRHKEQHGTSASQWLLRGEEPIQLEAKADSECAGRRALIYRWQVAATGSVYPGEESTGLGGVLSTKYGRSLAISAAELRQLAAPAAPTATGPGNYTVLLRVSVEGTIVYVTQQFHFRIVPAPIRATISGGSMRQVGRSDDVTMTADVAAGCEDTPLADNDGNNCSISWDCILVNNINRPCFFDQHRVFASWANRTRVGFNASLLLNAAAKRRPGSAPAVADHGGSSVWWRPGSDGYLFRLTVQRTDTSVATVTQLLETSPSNTIALGVKCLSCQDDGEGSGAIYVSANERALFAVECYDCDPTAPVHYEWQIWIVLDDGDGSPNSAYQQDCVRPDGSTHYFRSDDTRNNGSRGMPISSSVRGNATTSKIVDSDSINIGKPLGGADVVSPVDDLIKTVAFKRTENRKETTGKHNQRSKINHDIPVDEYGKPDFDDNEIRNVQRGGVVKMSDISEGHPGEGGRWKGRNQKTVSSQILDAEEENDNPHAADNGNAADVRDSGSKSNVGNNRPRKNQSRNPFRRRPPPVVDGARGSLGSPDPRADHLVGRPWESIHLQPTHTTTGLHGRHLAVKRGLLRPGKTYAVIVSATQGTVIGGKEGRAVQEVRSWRGPSGGRCTVAPSVGYEYVTEFRLDCREWSGDGQGPLFYQLTYAKPSLATVVPLVDDSLTDVEQDFRLIRHGPDNSFKFVLPSGNMEHNSKLTVTIIVSQNIGGSTSVCSVSVQVLPLQREQVASLHGFIDAEINSTKPTGLTIATYKGHISEIYNRIDVISHIIQSKRLQQSKHRFNPLKRALMTRLLALSTTNEEEVIMRLTTITSLVKAGVSAEMLNLSIREVAALAREWITPRRCRIFCEMGLRRVVEMASYTLTGIMRRRQTYLEPQDEPIYSIQRAVAGAALAALHGRLSSERHLVVVSDRLRLDASCRRTEVAAEKETVLPRDSSQLFSDELCSVVLTFRTERIVERNNFTEVAMDISSNVVLKYDDLTSSKFADSRINSSMQSNRLHELTWGLRNESRVVKYVSHMMDLYEFTVAEEFLGRTMVVVFHFFPDNEQTLDELFPLQFLLSFSELPCNQDECIFQGKMYYKSDESRPLVRSFVIPGDLFKKPGKYVLGMMNANTNFDSGHNYDRRYPQTSILTEISYLLNLQFVECLRWRESCKSWTSSDCTASVSFIESSLQIQCNCSAQSTYHTAKVIIPVSTYSRVEVYSFITPKCNLFVLLFLLVISVIIVILSFDAICPWKLFAVAGRTVRHECGLISSRDNDPADRRKYLVTLQTGYMSDAGTSASVYIVLHGENGKSGVTELTSHDQGLPVFYKGAHNRFILTTALNLGLVWKVQIWHNNAGISPSWYLRCVTVEDVVSGAEYYFPCDKWLSVGASDGIKIERELLVGRASSHFSQAFIIEFFRLKTKLDIWCSWIGNCPIDHFLSGERRLCSLILVTVILTLSTAYCAFFYSIVVTKQLNYNKFSVELIIVGFVVALIALSVVIILALSFHHTKLAHCISCQNKSNLGQEPKNKLKVKFETCDRPIESLEKIEDWSKELKDNDFSSGSQSSCKYSSGFKEDFDDLCYGSESSSIEECSATFKRRQRSKRIYSPRTDTSTVMFPVWLRYFIVCLSLLSIGGGVVFTWYYAIWFSAGTCHFWLLVNFLSLMVAHFLLFPMLAAAFGFVTLVRNRLHGFEPHKLSPCCSVECYHSVISSRDVSTLAADEEQSVVDSKRRKRLIRYTRPPGAQFLINSRRESLNTKLAFSYIRESLVILLVLVVLLVSATVEVNYQEHVLNKTLLKTFNRYRPLKETNNGTRWFEWMEENVIFMVHRNIQTNGNKVGKGFWFVGNTSSILIGNMVLRLTSPITFAGDKTINQASLTTFSLPRNLIYVQNELRNWKASMVNNSFQNFKVDLEFVIYNLPTQLFSNIYLSIVVSPSSSARSNFEIESVSVGRDGSSNNTSTLCKVFIFVIFIYELNSLILGKFVDLSSSLGSFCLFVKVTFMIHLGALLASQLLLSHLTQSANAMLSSSSFLDAPDISLLVTWRYICRAMLGMSILLHSVTCLRLLHRCHAYQVISGTLRRVGYISLATSLVTLLVSYAFLGTALFGGDDGRSELSGFDFQTPWMSVYTLIMATMRYPGRGEASSRAYERNSTFYVIYFGSFMLAALVIIVQRILPVLRTILTSSQDLQNVEFDVCSLIWKRFRTIFGVAKNTKEVPVVQTIPIAFALNELETSMEDVLFRITQLSRLEGVILADDLCNYASSDSISMFQNGFEDYILGSLFDSSHYSLKNGGKFTGVYETEDCDYILDSNEWLAINSESTSSNDEPSLAESRNQICCSLSPPTDILEIVHPIEVNCVVSTQSSPISLETVKTLSSTLDSFPESGVRCSFNRKIRRTKTKGKGPSGEELELNWLTTPKIH